MALASLFGAVWMLEKNNPQKTEGGEWAGELAYQVQAGEQ